MTGVSIGCTASPAQSAEGIPGNAVSRQQIVNVRTKAKRPTEMINAADQKITRWIGNCWRLVLVISYLFTTLRIVSLFRPNGFISVNETSSSSNAGIFKDV